MNAMMVNGAILTRVVDGYYGHRQELFLVSSIPPV